MKRLFVVLVLVTMVSLSTGPAVLANLSYEKSKIINWNPDTMKIVG